MSRWYENYYIDCTTSNLKDWLSSHLSRFHSFEGISKSKVKDTFIGDDVYEVYSIDIYDGYDQNATTNYGITVFKSGEVSLNSRGTSTFKILGENGNPLNVLIDSENGFWIKIPSQTYERYCFVQFEKDKYIYYSTWTYGSDYSSKKTFSPYEPILSSGVDGFGESGASITLYKRYVNSQSIQTGWESVGQFNFSPYQLKGVPSYGTEYGTVYNAYYRLYQRDTESVYFDSEPMQISIGQWQSTSYEIKYKGEGTYPKVYAGVHLGNDFAKSFCIERTRNNQYKTIKEVYLDGLDLDSIEIDSESERDYFIEGETISFSYNNLSYSLSSQNVKAISLAQDWHSEIKVPDRYRLGSVVSQKEMLSYISSRKIKYSDGELVDLSSTSFSLSVSNSKGFDKDGNFLVDKIDLFTISYSISSDAVSGGSKTKSVDCIVLETDDFESVKRAVLVISKRKYGYGDYIGFNSNEYISFIDGEGKEATRMYLTSENISKYVDFCGISRYATEKQDCLIEKTITVTPLEGLTFDLSLKYTVDWYEDSLEETVEHSKNTYIWYAQNQSEGLSFDDATIKLSSVFHKNSEEYGKVIKTEIRNYSVYMPSIDSIQDIRTTGRVSFSYTASNGQVLTFAYDINIVKYCPERIGIIGSNDTTKYFDNDADTFHLPSGLTFVIYYSDGTQSNLSNLSTISFYRDSDLTVELDEDSVISRKDGDRIYVRHSELDFTSSYEISWKIDAISSISLENRINVYAGNKPSRFKRSIFDAGINCTHESGIVTKISHMEDFSIKETEIVMSNLLTLHLIIDGNEYSLSNYVILYPYCKLTLESGYQTVYVNTADSIDPKEFVVKAEYYEESTFKTKCDFSEYPSDTNFTGYEELYGYVFDGKHAINIDLDGSAESTVSFEITSKNRFNNTKVKVDVPIKVIEVLEVTGLRLVRAKTDYKLNELFLNDGDDTEVQVFYKNQSNVTKTINVKLNSGFTALNIYPLRGTKLNTISNSKTVTITSATNSNVSVQYSINVSADIVRTETKHHSLVALWLEGYSCPDGVQRSAYFAVSRTADTVLGTVESTRISNGKRVLNYEVGVSDLEVFGYFDDIGDTSKSARLIMFRDYVPPIEGSNNITVKFPCYVSGNADIINKSRFGIMFGNNNSKNRLFVSGNPDYPNKDWHSGQASDEDLDDSELLEGNFGYFEDTSECSYGETDNEVIAYDIVSNDKLLVLKSKSDKETTVYFRQPQLVTAINGSGTSLSGLDSQTLYQEEFSLVRGNNSVAGTSPKAIANFNGDTVFISEDKHMCGLDLTGIIGDNQRYANSRSYYIDQDLKSSDMSDAFIWSDNRYLFLVTEEKVYATHYETKSSENSQYEWFVLGIKGVNCVFERNGIIYLGGKDGKIRMFIEGYEDKNKIFIGKGAYKVTVDDITEQLIISESDMSNIDPDRKYTFRNTPRGYEEGTEIYYSVGTLKNSASADCDFCVSNGNLRIVARTNGTSYYVKVNQLQSLLSEKEPIYLNRIDSSVQSIESDGLDLQGVRLWLEEIPSSTYHEYMVKDDNGNRIYLDKIRSARVCKVLSGEADVVHIAKSDRKFSLMLNGFILDIVKYGDQKLVNNFSGEIIEKSNVEAYYITAPETMGSLEYFKTVWSFTLTNDTSIPSEIEVCHANNKIPYEDMKTLAHISKDALGFDLNVFNFNSVDFDKNVVPRTYTSKRVLSGVKFLCFGFRNYNATNSVLSSMTVTYTTPYPSYSGD